MNRLILLVGPPGSGKTTYAKDLLKMNPEFVYINQDSQGKDYYNIFLDAVCNNKDIIVDRMNFSKEQRARFIGIVRATPPGLVPHSYKIDTVTFFTPKDECLARCNSRINHPTIKTKEDAIKAVEFFFKSYEKVEEGEVDNILEEYPVPQQITKEAIIVDLDGTLCDINHRLYSVKAPKKNWKVFFDLLIEDKVNDFCREIIEKFRLDHEIILVSGRPDNYKKQTEEWLQKNFIPYDKLFMRSRNDFRPDTIVKEQIYKFEIINNYKVLFCIDDRSSIVKMWRDNGLTCLQVADGDF